MTGKTGTQFWGTRGRGFESRHSDHSPARCPFLSPTQRTQVIRLVFLQLAAGPCSVRFMGVIRIIVIMEPTIAAGTGAGLGRCGALRQGASLIRSRRARPSGQADPRTKGRMSDQAHGFACETRRGERWCLPRPDFTARSTRSMDVHSPSGFSLVSRNGGG
jgi:hypothetical protein